MSGSIPVILAAAILAYCGYHFGRTDCDLTLRFASEQKIESKFRSKKIWVTGGSSGIGKALAKRLAKVPGTTILISARSEGALKVVKQEIIKDGGRCEMMILDLSDLASFPSKVKEAKELLDGDCDVLVNNGGISQRSVAIDTAHEVDMEILTVDLIAATLLTKLLVTEWMKREDKSEQKGIINISSLAGKIGVPLRTAYCAAKYGLLGFMDALRLEVSIVGNIGITNVCPGSVQTDVSKNARTGAGEKFGVTDSNIANGMDVDRCVDLIAKGYANDLHELWMFGSLQEKFGLYLYQYFPASTRQLLLRNSAAAIDKVLAAKKKD
jgi:dehydrogenase/reductase SDR family protein 7B